MTYRIRHANRSSINLALLYQDMADEMKEAQKLAEIELDPLAFTIVASFLMREFRLTMVQSSIIIHTFPEMLSARSVEKLGVIGERLYEDG